MRSEIIANVAYRNYEALSNYLPSKQACAKAAAALVVSTVAIEALSNIPGAEAGPVTYAACIAACGVATGPACASCLAACLPLLGPWCP